MALPFQVGGLPSYPTSFPYPPSLAQPFMVGGTTSPFPSSIIGLGNPTSRLSGLLTPGELASRVGNIQSMVTPMPGVNAAGAGSAVAPNLLQRLASPLLRGAENPGLWGQAEGFGAKAALAGKGLGYGVAGELGSMGIQKLLPGSSTGEHVLSGAAKGAGIGAGIGAIGLPIPVLGEITTGGGALLGGAIGALGGLLFGGKKKSAADQTINLAKLYQTANIDPATASQYDRYYKVLTSLDGSKEGRLKARQTIANLVLQKVAQGQAPGVHTLTPTEMAAMQAQTAAFLKPYTDQTIQTAQLAANNTLSQLPNVPEQFRGVLSAGAGNQLAAATRLANAYAAQAQLAPQAMALQQQQAAQQSLAQQLLQQSIAAQLAGGQGGGVDLNQLVGANG